MNLQQLPSRLMQFVSSPRLVSLCLMGGGLLIQSCAPKQREAEPPVTEAPSTAAEEVHTPETPQDVPQEPLQTQAPAHTEPEADSAADRELAALKAGQVPSASMTPDMWRSRYQQLIQAYAQSFQAPGPGDAVTLELTSGSRVSGQLTGLNASNVSVEMPMGTVSYPVQSLSERSKQQLFRNVYAESRARQHAMNEYNHWRQIHFPAAEQASAPAAQAQAPQRGSAPSTPSNSSEPYVSPLGRPMFEIP